MDLLETPPRFDLYDKEWKIYSRNASMPPHYVGNNAKVEKSIVAEGATIYGNLTSSVIFGAVTVGAQAELDGCVVMPHVSIGAESKLTRVIVCEKASIGKGCTIGNSKKVTVIGENVVVPDGASIPAGLQIDADYFA